MNSYDKENAEANIDTNDAAQHGANEAQYGKSDKNLQSTHLYDCVAAPG